MYIKVQIILGSNSISKYCELLKSHQLLMEAYRDSSNSSHLSSHLYTIKCDLEKVNNKLKYEFNTVINHNP